MPFDPTQVLFGAAVGFGFSAGLRWWQYSRDLWLQRIQHLCDACQEAADCSSSYWLAESDPEKPTSDAAAEAKILGLQIHLDGTLDAIRDRIGYSDCKNLDSVYGKLIDALTGGNFQSRPHKVDLDRARSVHLYASEMAIAARSAADRALSIRGTFAHFLRNLF